MEKNNHIKKLFTYSIKDNKGQAVISLFFTVDFFEIENQLYLENSKTRILVEAIDENDGKISFQEMIDRKVRDSIMNGNFYKLITNWNMTLRPINEIIEEKAREISEHNLNKIESDKIETNTKKILNDIEIDFDMQLKYSSAMINNFEESISWENTI